MTKKTNLLLLGWFATSKFGRTPSHLSRRYLVAAVLCAAAISVAVWWCNQHLGTQVVDPTSVGG